MRLLIVLVSLAALGCKGSQQQQATPISSAGNATGQAMTAGAEQAMKAQGELKQRMQDLQAAQQAVKTGAPLPSSLVQNNPIPETAKLIDMILRDPTLLGDTTRINKIVDSHKWEFQLDKLTWNPYGGMKYEDASYQKLVEFFRNSWIMVRVDQNSDRTLTLHFIKLSQKGPATQQKIHGSTGPSRN